MNGRLCVESSGAQTKVEVQGKRTDVMFNWTVLTHTICKDLGIPPLALAGMLPTLIQDYEKKILKGAAMFDLSAIKKQAGGDKRCDDEDGRR